MSELKAWLKTAKPGDNFIYHVGAATVVTQQSPEFKEARRQEGIGVITLKQRRLSDGVYEYIAERISRKTLKAIQKLNDKINEDEDLSRAVARRG